MGRAWRGKDLNISNVSFNLILSRVPSREKTQLKSIVLGLMPLDGSQNHWLRQDSVAAVWSKSRMPLELLNPVPSWSHILGRPLSTNQIY